MALGHEPTHLVTDADVLMNLLASEYAEQILTTLQVTQIVPPAVAGEAIYLEGTQEGSAREAVNLSRLQAAGLLMVMPLDASELDVVVELAATVDDGEAEVIAIALARRMTMATDDRKARRIAEQRAASVVSTPELLYQWQLVGSIPDPHVRQALSSIERRSRYRPGANHPLHDWWNMQTKTRTADDAG